jgi:hypothetical protein
MLGAPESGSGLHGEHYLRYRDSNSDTSVVQPVTSRYTDYAIPVYMNYVRTPYAVQISYTVQLNAKSVKPMINLKHMAWDVTSRMEVAQDTCSVTCILK